MFSIGESFIYGSYGICELTGIQDNIDMDKKTRPYYVLKPVFETDSKVYIPVGNKALHAKMRRLLTSDEIHTLIAGMPYEESIWIENENERKEYFKRILAEGDRTSLVRMIESIFLHQEEIKESGKKLHVSDACFLKDAEKLLYGEFAYVLGIKREDVLPFILAHSETA